MTTWARSLIRISTYEVETLQKRLAEIGSRRASAEMRLAVLDAEVEIERERARADAEAGMLLQAYLSGWKHRKSTVEADLFEHVAERSRLERLAAAERRESAAFDALGLRRRA